MSAAARRAVTRPRPIDVYKKLSVIRTTDDEIFDENGSAHSVTIADLSREVGAPVKTQKRLNIPIAPVREQPDYEAKTKGGFVPPVAYIRHVKRSEEQARDMLEYVLEHKDEQWLSQRGHGPNLLDADKLERALDLLEKATNTGTPITQDAAEGVLTTKLGMQATSASREVVADVYQYWLAKRLALEKPLLRRFWPTTAPDDTNPHNVFRPREKERYKLRKHRKNDMESFRKMQQLRRELDKVRVLLDLVRHREHLKRLQVAVGSDSFEQKVRTLAGTSSASSETGDAASSGDFQPSVEQAAFDAVVGGLPSLAEDDGLARAREKRLAAASGADYDSDASDGGDGAHPKGDGSGCGGAASAGGGPGGGTAGGALGGGGVFVEDVPTFLERSVHRHTPLPWVRCGRGAQRKAREPRVAVYDGTSGGSSPAAGKLARLAALGATVGESSGPASAEGEPFLFERLLEQEGLGQGGMEDALVPSTDAAAGRPRGATADPAAALAAEVKGLLEQASTNSNSAKAVAEDPDAPVTFSCRGRVGRGGRIIFDRTSTGVISSTRNGRRQNHLSFGAGLGQRGGLRTSRAPVSEVEALGTTTSRSTRKRTRSQVRDALVAMYAESDSEEEDLNYRAGLSKKSTHKNLSSGATVKYEIAV